MLLSQKGNFKMNPSKRKKLHRAVSNKEPVVYIKEEIVKEEIVKTQPIETITAAPVDNVNEQQLNMISEENISDSKKEKKKKLLNSDPV